MKLVTLDILTYFWGNVKTFLAANYVALEEGKGLSTNDFTTAEKEKLAGIAESAQANVIEGITVNGTTVTPANKVVNIDLSNYALKSDVTGAMKMKGSVQTYADLPASPAENDAYRIITADAEHHISAGELVLWNGTEWIDMGGAVDTSAFVTTETLNSELAKKVDVVDGKGLSTNDYTTTEKNKLAGIATGAQVNVLEKVSVNGTALTITNKGVNIDLSAYAKTADFTEVTEAEIDALFA